MRKATLYTRVQLLPCYRSDISPIWSRGGGSGLEWRQSGCRRGPSWWRYRTWSRCRSPRLTKWNWLSYRNISHILTLFETPASRQCALGRLQILVDKKTGKSVQRFPKLIAVHIQLDEIENECLCLKLKEQKFLGETEKIKWKCQCPNPRDGVCIVLSTESYQMFIFLDYISSGRWTNKYIEHDEITSFNVQRMVQPNKDTKRYSTRLYALTGVHPAKK